MIYPQKNRFLQKLFSFYVLIILKKHFAKLHLRGEEKIKNIINKYPIIFYMNHSCWWDPIIVFYLSVIRWRLNGYAIMDIVQLKKYPFFSKFGTFSIDRNNARSALKSIDFAAQILNNGNNAIWIFPQGEMLPSQYRPIRFYTGIARIINKTSKVQAIPITFHYEFIEEQRPEIFISISEPIEFINPNFIHKLLTNKLLDILVDDLELQKNNISNKKFDEYIEIIKGKTSISNSFHNFRRKSVID